jgi:hypothetical protein
MYVRNGLPVYLRLRNFPDLQNNLAVQMGFAISPSGGQLGTTDILIGPPLGPPPAVQSLSMHSIGMSEGKLRFGAKEFLISSTFSDNMVRLQGYANETDVWSAPNVVGLVTNGALYSIEDIRFEQLAGKTVTWKLLTNAVGVGG